MSFDPATILDHDARLRRLARALVRDEAAADDLVQIAWLAALANRDAARQPLAWRTGALRNLVRERFRREVRRELREHAAAVPEASPGTAELLEREAVRKAVFDAVLALDEPLRRTLVLRYFEDLPPREIAHREQTPIDTVNTRIRRGIEVLRHRVAELDPHDRRRPFLALAPFAAGAPLERFAGWATSWTTGILFMNTPAKVGSFLVVLALTATFVFTRMGTAPTNQTAEPTVATRSETDQPENFAPPPATLEAPSIAREEANTDADDVAAQRQDGVVGAGLVVSVVYEPDLAPAAGLAIDVTCHSDTDPYRESRSAVTDANGEVRFEALTPGYASLSSDRGGMLGVELERGVIANMEFRIPLGAIVSGRVVDGARQPVAAASIFLSRQISAEGSIVASTTVDGRFSLRNVSSLHYVGARKDGFAPSELKLVLGGSSGQHEFDLSLDAVGGTLEGVVFGLDGSPLRNARIVFDPENVAAKTSGYGHDELLSIPQLTTSDAAGRFRFGSLPVGRFSVAAKAPGHSIASADVEVVRGGITRTALRAARSGRVVGSVKDESGAPIARAEIRSTVPDAIDSFWSRSGKDGEFVLADVSAGDRGFVVEAEGFNPLKRSILVASEQEARIELVLSRGATIRGVVVDVAGLPLAAVSIECSAEDDSAPAIQVHTDAAGMFEVTGASRGKSTLNFLVQPSYLFPSHTERGVVPDGPPLRITLSDATLPSVKFRGRVLGPEKSPLPGARVSIAKMGINMAPLLTTDIEGRFEYGPAPPGRYTVFVDVDGFPMVRRGPFEFARNADHDFGDFQLVAGGNLIVRIRRSPGLEGVEFGSSVTGSDGTRAETVADAEGLRAKHLAPGRHELSISGQGIASLVIPFSIEPATDTTLEVTLTEGLLRSISYRAPLEQEAAWIECRIVTRDGKTVSKPRLFRKAAGEPHRTRVWLEPGDFVFELLRDDASPQRIEFTVTLGGSEDLVFELK